MKIKKILPKLITAIILVILGIIIYNTDNLFKIPYREFMSVTNLVPWIRDHGYFIFYAITLVDSTIVTTAAGVVASLGYYNIIIIFIIATIGDVTSDIICYFTGFYIRHSLAERYERHLGLKKEQIEKIENMVHRHFGKAMLIIKISPIITVPGLIAIGGSHVSLRKFTKMSVLVATPKALFFALLGFYSGKAYMHLDKSINNGSYALGICILIIIAIYFIYKKIMKNIQKKFEL